MRCLEGERDHDVGQQKRTMSCSWVGKEKAGCGVEDLGELATFLRAVVVVPVVSVIILIHFVVFIFSLRMYAQQVFLALFTCVSNTIACVCGRGVSEVFPAGLRFVFVSSVGDSFG